MDKALTFVAGGGSIFLVALIALLFFPERVQQAVALIWRALWKLGLFARRAHKEYVKYDLQGHLNHFLRRRMKDVPGVAAKGVRLDWVDQRTSKQAFLKDEKVIVRLHRDEDNSRNFVHATYHFISTSLLYRAKRYLSDSQGDATDLFVSMLLLQEEKPEVVDAFLEDFLHRRLDQSKSKVPEYFDSYAIIQGGGFFFPIFLQEMTYLGEKVFGGPRSAMVNTEVDGFIDFLKTLAQRRVGDESVPLEFVRNYCRFALVIIGKPTKLTASIEPYVTFIEKRLRPIGVETLYLLGLAENTERIREIAAEVADFYDIAVERRFRKVLEYSDHAATKLSFLLVLRSRRKELYIPTVPAPRATEGSNEERDSHSLAPQGK